jgi:hypothetical protein
MQRAMVRLWDGYSDAELKLLLRFANESYQTLLNATSEVKTAVAAAPKARATELRR